MASHLLVNVGLRPAAALIKQGYLISARVERQINGRKDIEHFLGSTGGDLVRSGDNWFPYTAIGDIPQYTSASNVDITIVFEALDAKVPAGENPILGLVSFTLEEAISNCQTKHWEKNLGYGAEPEGQKSTALLWVEHIKQEVNPTTVKFDATATGLDKMDSGIGAKSDPFFILYRTYNSGSGRIPVFRSNYITKTLEPNWGVAITNTLALCGGESGRAIDLEVWDWDAPTDKNGHDFIGRASFTLASLEKAKTGTTGMLSLSIINPEKAEKKKGSYTNSGQVILSSINTSLHYAPACVIKAENKVYWQVDFRVAIGTQVDAKKSEEPVGDIGKVALRFFTNEFWKAAGAKVFGFTDSGSKYVGPGEETDGGSLSTEYTIDDAFAKIAVPGAPATKLLPVVQNCCVKTNQLKASKPNAYFVYFIFTYDGFSDYDEVVNFIIQSCVHQPMSLVFVGLGSHKTSNWKNLDLLQSNPFGLRTKKEVASRDLVQVTFFERYPGSFQTLERLGCHVADQAIHWFALQGANL